MKYARNGVGWLCLGVMLADARLNPEDSRRKTDR